MGQKQSTSVVEPITVQLWPRISVDAVILSKSEMLLAIKDGMVPGINAEEVKLVKKYQYCLINALNYKPVFLNHDHFPRGPSVIGHEFQINDYDLVKLQIIGVRFNMWRVHPNKLSTLLAALVPVSKHTWARWVADRAWLIVRRWGHCKDVCGIVARIVYKDAMMES